MPRRAAAGEAAAALPNVAFVFVKPHACTPAALEFVPRFLEDHTLEIVNSGKVAANIIDARGIIDAHYAAIARVGMTRDVSSLGLGDSEAKKFSEGYDLPWAQALDAGLVHSAATALELLEVSPSTLLDRCLAAGYVKMGSGLYCAKLEGPTGGPPEIYVLNGFYARMREKFVGRGAMVHWFVVRFDEATLSWRDFRSNVIGATNPADSADGSLRAAFRERWQEFSFSEAPNYQDNGVHASAGPLESLKERQIWLGDDPKADAFGSALAAACGEAFEDLLADPVVDIDGRSGSAFELLEDTGACEALKLLSACTVSSY